MININSGQLLLILLLSFYHRVLPAIFLAVGLVITFPIWLPPGPLNNDFIANEMKKCEQNGLWNFLFLQNYLHPSEMVTAIKLLNFKYYF